MLIATVAVVLALAATDTPAEGATPAAGDAAPAAAPAEPVKPAKPEPDPNKRICVEEQTMGSLFKRRICATRAEWEARRTRDNESMQTIRDAGNVAPRN